MAEFVNARHKVTGLIESIPESHLELIPAFERIDDNELEDAQAEQEVKVYGEALEGREILDVVEDRPDAGWRKDDLLDYAEEHGIESVDQSKTKAEILEAINTQEGVK